MDSKDIAKIKIGSEAFTKAWWQKRRAILANGSGVGKALDEWNKNCSKDPEKLIDKEEIEAARSTCKNLKDALEKAKKKCGRLAKDTSDACDAYIKAVEGYENSIGKYYENADEDKELWLKIQDQIEKANMLSLTLGKECERQMQTLRKLTSAARDAAEMVSDTVAGKTKFTSEQLGKFFDQIEAGRSEVTKFLEKKMAVATSGDKEVETLAKKLKTTDYQKKILLFYKSFENFKTMEEELRNENFKCELIVDNALEHLRGALKDEEVMLSKFEYLHTIIWGNPGSSIQDMPENFQRLVERAHAIIKKSDLTLTESDKRVLREEIDNLSNDLVADRTAINSIVKAAQRLQAQFKPYADHPKLKTWFARLPNDLRSAAAAQQNAVRQVDTAAKVAGELLEA